MYMHTCIVFLYAYIYACIIIYIDVHYTFIPVMRYSYNHS
jgi:hypothetical protein